MPCASHLECRGINARGGRPDSRRPGRQAARRHGELARPKRRGKRAACDAISVRQKYQLMGIRQEISASLAAFKCRPDREVQAGVKALRRGMATRSKPRQFWSLIYIAISIVHCVFPLFTGLTLFHL